MLIIQAKFERVNVLETKTNLVFSTKDDLNEIQIAQIERSHGHLAFSVDQLKKEVEEAMRDTKIGIDESGMSKSKIQRGVLYQVWEKSDEEIGFDDFYKREMDKIINHYKQKYL